MYNFPHLCHYCKKGGSQREFNESAWTRSEYIYDTVEMFDIYNMRWQQVTSMNSGRILPGIAVLNGKGKPYLRIKYNHIQFEL